MPRLKAANNAETTLAAGITSTDTSLTVVDSSLFPDSPFRITIDAEIIEVGAIDRVNHIFSSLQRGLEGTVAAAHSAGASVQNRFTAGTHAELFDDSTSLTVDQAVVPTGSTGVIRNLLSGLANRIKAITGKTNWYDTPDITLATLAAHKTRHATGGVDALAPADIGAAPSSHNHAGSDIISAVTEALRVVAGGNYRISDSTGPQDSLLAGDRISVDFVNNFSGGGSQYKTIVTIRGYSSNNGAIQLAFPYNDGTSGDHIYVRVQNFDSTTWGPWYKVWHAGNDGAGSGLDADLVRGRNLAAEHDAHLADYAPHGATSANTANRIVMRDASGNFSAGTITATLAGSADKVDNIHFRVYNGVLQYNDGTGWKNVANNVTVQRGITSITNGTVNVTISSVNTAKSFVIVTGTHNESTTVAPAGTARARLTSSTNLELMSEAAAQVLIAWEVVQIV